MDVYSSFSVYLWFSVVDEELDYHESALKKFSDTNKLFIED